MLTGTPLLVVLGAGSAWSFDWGTVSPLAWGGTAYATFLGLATAAVLFNYALKVLEGSRTGVFLSLIPVVALLVAAVVLAERPSALQVAGMVFILGGVVDTRSREVGGPLLECFTGPDGECDVIETTSPRIELVLPVPRVLDETNAVTVARERHHARLPIVASEP